MSLRDRTECYMTKVFGLSDRLRCQESGTGRRGIVRRRRGHQRAARLRVEGFPSDTNPLGIGCPNRSTHTSLGIDEGDAFVL